MGRGDGGSIAAPLLLGTPARGGAFAHGGTSTVQDGDAGGSPSHGFGVGRRAEGAASRVCPRGTLKVTEHPWAKKARRLRAGSGPWAGVSGWDAGGFGGAELRCFESEG